MRIEINTTSEMRSAVKRNYDIMIAAIKVREIKEEMNKLEAERRETNYDVTHTDIEGNRRFFEVAEKGERIERKVKKTIKNFYKLVEEDLPKNFSKMYAHEAIYKYDELVRDFALWNIKQDPFVEISILKTL